MQAELSDVQLAFWRAWRSFPEHRLDHRSMKIEWRRQLDVDAFEAALQDLVDKTDALRLRFDEQDDLPRQSVVEACSADLLFRDFSDINDARASAVAWLCDLEALPFDLRARVFVTALAKVSEDHWIWLLNQHHIVTDFTSSALLVARLSELYQARRNGTPIAGSYPSFLAFHQDRLGTQSRITVDASRVPRLHPALHNDPVRLPRPRQFVRRVFHLGQDRLKRFRNQYGLADESHEARFMAHLYATLLSTTFIYMHRLSGETQLAIGTMSHGRFSQDSESIVGPLILNLPIDIEIEENSTCADVHTAVQSRRRDVFRAIRQGADIQGRLGGAILNFVPQTMPDFGGVRSSEITDVRGQEAISCDLHITVRASDTPGDVKVLFNLSEDVITQMDADVMAQVYLRILDALVDSPECKIGEIPLFGEEDVRRETERAQSAHAAGPLPYQSLVEGFLQQAARTPTSIAVIDGAHQLTFQDLEQRSRSVASALIARGIQPGHVVATRLPRSADLVVALLGILRSGGTFLTLDLAQPAKRVEHILDDSQAQALILPNGESQPTFCYSGTTFDLQTLLTEGRSNPTGLALIDPTSTMYVIYTSGTTGRPKGIRIPHLSFARYHAWACQILSAGLPSDWPLATSLDFESAYRAFVALTTGGKIVIYRDTDTVTGMSVMKALREDQIDGLTLTPSLLRPLCDQQWITNKLRTLIIIGEPLLTALAQKAKAAFGNNVRLYNFYGPTETTMACTAHLFCAKTDNEVTVPVGKPGDGTCVHILDAAGQPVPDGMIGEICIGGTRLSQGYVNQPDLDAEKFVPNRFHPGGMIYKSGDLGRYDKAGALVHHGRTDDQVKINGIRVELAEVEASVTQHPGVEKCAVIATGHPSPWLVAFYVAERDISGADLRGTVAQQLARGLVPKTFVRINAIPMATNGKTDRRALLKHVPSEGQETSDQTLAKSAPVGPTERTLAVFWQRLLKLRAVARDDDFFECGGDSLAFVQMIATVERECNVSLPLEQLGDRVTLQRLANLMDQQATQVPSKSSDAHPSDPEQSPHPTSALAWSEVRSRMMLTSNAWTGTRVGQAMPVLRLNEAGPRPPLFWCFNQAGEPQVMAALLGRDQPLYAMRSMQAVVERSKKAEFYDSLAQQYVQEIRALEPSGPYYLGGNCQSGRIADRIARAMGRQGLTVAHLFLLDYIPEEDLDVPISLFFGRDCERFNPFLKEARPDIRWRKQFPTVTWDILPGRHGRYFGRDAAPTFIGRLSDHLTTAQRSHHTAAREAAAQSSV